MMTAESAGLEGVRVMDGWISSCINLDGANGRGWAVLVGCDYKNEVDGEICLSFRSIIHRITTGQPEQPTCEDLLLLITPVWVIMLPLNA